MQQDSSPPADAPIPLEAIDLDAVKVLRRLQRNDFKAYLVGGCVRDLLLKRSPKDFDIATDARPRQIKRLFRNSRIIGRRFRLVHIHFGPHVLEVATFRAPPVTDGDEDDLYIRRDNVFGTEEQDARRRDFTINGLFYDVHRARVIDHVNGVADLRAGLLRTIGDPDVRLREDPVRILRAARFAGRLEFELTPDLQEAAFRHREDLRKAAPPRVLEEFYRLLSGHGSAHAFRVLQSVGALDVLLPEVAPPAEEFYAALERLEKESGGSRNGASQSLLLAVLLWDFVRERLREAEPHLAEGVVQQILQPVLERLTVARRDSARARQCIVAQKLLAEPPDGRLATRLCRRDFFDEALRLMRIVASAKDGVYEMWAERGHEAGSSPPARRRRQRRRRGRRGRGGKAPPAI